MDEHGGEDIFLRDTGLSEIAPPQVKPLTEDVPKTSGPRNAIECTRVVLMSDSHGQHRSCAIPSADVLVHAGDMTQRGESGTMLDLTLFFHELQQSGTFQQIIVIAGNHDLSLQSCKAVNKLKGYCTYLQDQSCTLFPTSDLHVYGSPWSLEFGSWAFMKRPDEMKPLWEAVPDDTDILITHGPPYHRGDEVDGEHVGCVSLLKEVQDRIQPRLHVFGHIHESRGFVGFDGKTLFVNASNVNLRYHPVQPCLVVDVPHDRSLPVRVVEPISPVSSFEEFLEWLGKRPNVYDSLTRHLRTVDSSVLDDSISWEHPWSALSFLSIIFCHLSLHRDGELQESFQRALRDLYVDSFA